MIKTGTRLYKVALALPAKTGKLASEMNDSISIVDYWLVPDSVAGEQMEIRPLHVDGVTEDGFDELQR
jgi:hypothetical protein